MMVAVHALNGFAAGREIAGNLPGRHAFLYEPSRARMLQGVRRYLPKTGFTTGGSKTAFDVPQPQTIVIDHKAEVDTPPPCPPQVPQQLAGNADQRPPLVCPASLRRIE